MSRSNKRLTRRQCLALMSGAAAAALAPALSRAETASAILRLAISVDTLAGANVNDARTAYRVWLHEVSGQFGAVTAVVVPEVFLPSEQLVRDVRQGAIDCYGVTAPELARVAELTDPDSLVLEDYLADGMEYVLLVHNSSSFKTLADLRGARIVSHLHRDMVLLPAWLDTMLAANSLPRADQFFAAHELRNSLNMVVLPVFFHRMDAACLARRHWQTAVELNPQLGRDVRVLATSPKVIPILFGFRRTTTASARQALIHSIQHISTVPAGQQIVALYQSSGFMVKPISVMKATIEMVRQFERLPAAPAGLRKAGS